MMACPDMALLVGRKIISLLRKSSTGNIYIFYIFNELGVKLVSLYVQGSLLKYSASSLSLPSLMFFNHIMTKTH